MTNPFRPGRPASLLVNGEAQKACRAEGLCAKATAGVKSTARPTTKNPRAGLIQRVPFMIVSLSLSAARGAAPFDSPSQSRLMARIGPVARGHGK